MFSYQHCPLLQSKLSWPMRIMYSSGVWSYIVGAISTPTFILIPMITIWFGVFPIVVSQWTALGVTVYYFATNLVSPAFPDCTACHMHVPFHHPLNQRAPCMTTNTGEVLRCSVIPVPVTHANADKGTYVQKMTRCG